MLRCIELTNVRTEDVSLDFRKKMVTLNVRKSKMDQAAEERKILLHENVSLGYGTQSLGGSRQS